MHLTFKLRTKSKHLVEADDPRSFIEESRVSQSSKSDHVNHTNRRYGVKNAVEEEKYEDDEDEVISFDYENQDLIEKQEQQEIDNNVHIKIEPKNVFKVPLMWMMPDSQVDVAIHLMELNNNNHDHYI